MTDDDWYKLSLDLDSFDETSFRSALEGPLAAGLRLEDFTHLGNGTETRQKLYGLNKACSRK